MPELNEEAIEDLNRRWADAEVRGDIAALDALATDDFRLIGPAGFVLDKQQWLDRYRDGDLVTRSLRFEDAQTHLYGDTAVSIGRHVQQAEYQGHPVNGEFRSTHVAVREGDRWRLAGCQLSPIGGPPPFAPPGGPARPGSQAPPTQAAPTQEAATQAAPAQADPTEAAISGPQAAPNSTTSSCPHTTRPRRPSSSPGSWGCTSGRRRGRSFR
jgi:ketosteroid isomerase-like protein